MDYVIFNFNKLKINKLINFNKLILIIRRNFIPNFLTQLKNVYIDRRFWISIYVNTNTNRVERKIGVSPRINRLDPHLFRETFFFLTR